MHEHSVHHMHMRSYCCHPRQASTNLKLFHSTLPNGVLSVFLLFLSVESLAMQACLPLFHVRCIIHQRCCAVQRQRQRLLRCWKSQQWICRPLSGSLCASMSRVSILLVLPGLLTSNEPFVTCHPPGCFVRWTCSSMLCCAYIFASSTRTGRTEHELLCCNI